MTQPVQPIRLHGFPLSGHSHRVELFLNLLGLPYQFIAVNLAGGEHLQPDFLSLNPFGQVPVIEDGAVVLADSNAILVYLAQVYDPARRWLPTDPLRQAQIQRWLSVAAGDLAFGPALARIIRLFKRPADIVQAQAVAQRLLQRLEAQLGANEWLVGDTASIADLALYSYTARAPEGEVALDDFPAIRAWLDRVEALPRFHPMPRATS